MSHISEGDLHVVLDGAVDLLEADRARFIERHIEECRECARRLNEERAVRDRALELLEGTAPGRVESPPFEMLAAMARGEGGDAALGDAADGALTSPSGAGDPGRGMTRGIRLAWAATVVLSLGIGYLGSSVFRPAVTGSGSFRASEATASLESTREAPEQDVGSSATANAPPPLDDALPASPEPAGAAVGQDPRLARRLESAAPPTPQEPLADEPAPPLMSASVQLVPPPPAFSEGLTVLSVTQSQADGEAPGLELLHGLPSGDTVTIRWVWAAGGSGTALDELAEEAVEAARVSPLGAAERSALEEEVRQDRSSDSAAVQARSAAGEAAFRAAVEENQRAAAGLPFTAGAARRAVPSRPPPNALGADPVDAARRRAEGGRAEESAAPAEADGATGQGPNRATIDVGGWRVEAVGPISRDSLLAILEAITSPGGS